MKHLIFLFCVSCFFSNTISAQSQKSLERKRAALQKEIAKTNKLLFETEKEGEDLLGDLKSLNHKINLREKLISSIHQESSGLQKKINVNEAKRDSLDKNLVNLKKDYAQMILKSFKSKSEQSKLMFLLSSDNFQQAYKRYKYMQQYANYRKKQGDSIAVKTEEILAFTQKLKQQKQQKNVLLQENKKEQDLIEGEKSKQQALISQVNSKAKKYKKQIKKKEAEERKLNKAIEDLIRRAIAASSGKKKSKVTKSSKFVLTPEAKALAVNFESNRGKLPWPVKEGIVTRNYGVIGHPTLRGIKIDSKGIHITTAENAVARAVFKGKVLAIQSVSGRNAVYVQHGNYISLYNNLDKVYVSKGQEVALKQTLGSVFKDRVTGKTILKFQIWKDTQRQNPKTWLISM